MNELITVFLQYTYGVTVSVKFALCKQMTSLCENSLFYNYQDCVCTYKILQRSDEGWLLVWGWGLGSGRLLALC